ncbi:proline-rich receptor-like protein kinase PERK1 isoform X2 [Homarus americanus]|uniref:proline-rich receptor-like protein kinase PERK1 isoform X2 n=1 Tax=Homarus americanus TaxID=6706 RepID=UPI001C48D0E3|nr:proline-rich receptor-like protein kinase PERK1 isoform X2 [Homarus americanus]
MFPSLDIEVYNMLITTLFLLFVLTTVALLIFLLMRRPPCCPCCRTPYDTSASATGSNGSQAAHITYLTETHGIVVKKWMKDSPPPYESPPDYNSLSPELIMDAKTLQELVSTTTTTTQSPHNPTTSSSSQPRSSSPLCTTPLFSPPFCDSPRSLTPTVHQEGKLLGVFDRPPSPIFTSHQQYPSSTNSHCHPSTAAYVASSTAPATVPSAVYGGQATPSPPAYESLRLYSHDGSRRKEDNQ